MKSKIVFDKAAARLKKLCGKESVLIIDKFVAEAYPHLLITDKALILEGGESAKSVDTLIKTLEFFKSAGASRFSDVLAVGGGTITDMAGFAASVYMRGIPWHVFPTTLLAMADAAIGGKTAINLSGVKNLIGAFHKPATINIDTEFLYTLPEKDTRDGLAEIIKTAFIGEKKLVSLLLSGSFDMEKAIRLCAKTKSEIVAADPYELGLRAVLNVGHTVGHAIESDSGFEITHGEAVATGMYIETRVAAEIKLIHERVLKALEACLVIYYYPLDYKPQDEESFFAALLSDKKRALKTLKFPYIAKVGKSRIAEIDTEEFIRRLKKALRAN